MIHPLICRDLAVRKKQCAVYTDCKLVETHLQHNKYLIGDQLSIADYFTVGTLQFAIMVFHKMLYADYSCLVEWFLEIYETPPLRR